MSLETDNKEEGGRVLKEAPLVVGAEAMYPSVWKAKHQRY